MSVRACVWGTLPQARTRRHTVYEGCLFAFGKANNNNIIIIITTTVIATITRSNNNHTKESCFCRSVAPLYDTKRCALTSFIKIKTQRKEQTSRAADLLSRSHPLSHSLCCWCCCCCAFSSVVLVLAAALSVLTLLFT